MQASGVAPGRGIVDIVALDQKNVGARSREVIGERASHQAAADHEDVRPLHQRDPVTLGKGNFRLL